MSRELNFSIFTQCLEAVNESTMLLYNSWLESDDDLKEQNSLKVAKAVGIRNFMLTLAHKYRDCGMIECGDRLNSVIPELEANPDMEGQLNRYISEKHGVDDLDLAGYLKHAPKNPSEVYNPDEDLGLVLPRFFLRHFPMMFATIDDGEFRGEIGEKILETFNKQRSFEEIEGSLYRRRALMNEIFYEIIDLNKIPRERLKDERGGYSFSDLFGVGANYVNIVSMLVGEFGDLCAGKDLEMERDKKEHVELTAQILLQDVGMRESLGLATKLKNGYDIDVMAGYEIEFGLEEVSEEIERNEGFYAEKSASIGQYILDNFEYDGDGELEEAISNMTPQELLIFDVLYLSDARSRIYLPEAPKEEDVLNAILSGEFNRICLDMDVVYEVATHPMKLEESRVAYNDAIGVLLEKSYEYGFRLRSMPSVQTNLSFWRDGENLCIPEVGRTAEDGEVREIHISEGYNTILAGIQDGMEYGFDRVKTDLFRDLPGASVSLDLKEGFYGSGIHKKEFNDITSPYVVDRFTRAGISAEERMKLDWYQKHRDVSAKDAVIRVVYGGHDSPNASRVEVRMFGSNGHIINMQKHESAETDSLYSQDIVVPLVLAGVLSALERSPRAGNLWDKENFWNEKDKRVEYDCKILPGHQRYDISRQEEMEGCLSPEYLEVFNMVRAAPVRAVKLSREDEKSFEEMSNVLMKVARDSLELTGEGAEVLAEGRASVTEDILRREEERRGAYGGAGASGQARDVERVVDDWREYVKERKVAVSPITLDESASFPF